MHQLQVVGSIAWHVTCQALAATARKKEKLEDWTLRAFPQSESCSGMTVALDLFYPRLNDLA